MKVPRSHADILEQPVRSILNTIKPEYQPSSDFCQCEIDGDIVLLSRLKDDQVYQVKSNPKISIMVIDPINVDRWLCIQGDIINVENLPQRRCKVRIKRIIHFPK